MVEYMAKFIRCKIYGLALEPPTNPSLYDEANLDNIVKTNLINVKDNEKVINLVQE